ncbi:MAG: hypothetical protein JXQ73_28745 [Phycisphaerae bacterium]|nr:hypothetical protein [Phycisphaerae bacterium]
MKQKSYVIAALICHVLAYPCVCFGTYLWDTHTPITATLTVEDTDLCWYATHSVQAEDKDKRSYTHSGDPSPCYPDGVFDDTLTYEWSKSVGSNPQTGTFTSPTSGEGVSTVDWTAPPCTGTVKIKVQVDDKPDPMTGSHLADGSTRNDPAVEEEDFANVTLPSGCNDAGAHDNSVHWPDPLPAPTFNYTAGWGVTHTDAFKATYDLEMAYDNCTWVPQITNVQTNCTIEVHTSPFAGHVDVTNPNDIPCANALDAINDLWDADLHDGGSGPPRNVYWSQAAIVAHEEKHRTEWIDAYTDALDAAIATIEADCTIIDCSDYWTKTCQDAESTREDAIATLMNQAFTDAETALAPQVEWGPSEAAAVVYDALIDSIEDRCGITPKKTR